MKTVKTVRSALICVISIITLGVAGVTRADSPTYSAASYVTDGLVGLWDAEENAGFGQHEESPEVWKDLSGQGRDMTVTASGQFSAKGFRKVDVGPMASRAGFIDGIRTVEVVLSDVPTAGWAVPVFLTNWQAIAVKDVLKDEILKRQITTSYWRHSDLGTTDRPAVSSISALYGISGGKLEAMGTTHCGVADKGEMIGGLEPRGDGLCVGCSYEAQERDGDYKTTGYVVHSIRLYNRELTDAERQRNLLIDSVRFGSPCLAALDKLDFTWTGDAGDGKFSSSGNWKDGFGPVPTEVTTGNLYLPAKGAGTIANDVGELKIKGMYVSQANGSADPLTLTGEPIGITGEADITSKDHSYRAVLSNGCPLTVEMPLSFTGSKSGQYNGAPLTLNGDVTVSSVKFTFFSATSKTLTLNGNLTAPNATIGARGYHALDIHGTLKVDYLDVGSVNDGDQFNLYAGGNEWSGASVAFYGSLALKVADALPESHVFTWKGGSLSSWSGTQENYTLSGSQTADRIEAACLKLNGVGAIMPRQRIVSDAQNVTLTLKGTKDAISYGVLQCGSNCDLNLVWAPTGNFSQTFADLAHTMHGTLAVKGGTLVSAGTNSFASVTALDVTDGATFAVRMSADNAAANPFTGVSKPALTLSGSGKIEVPTGVTVPFSTGWARGAILAVDTYQAMDGTDATAKRVPWVAGDGLVQITVAGDGTSWADAAVSGDWDDPANWSNGLPDPTKPVYLTAEGDNYVVTMKNGTVWPQNLVIRGANAKLVVGVGQTVEFDGMGKTASVSIEEGGTLSVAGSLSIVDYNGSFTVGSTTIATSRVEVVTGGTFFYTPRYQVARPITVNVGGAVDVAGGVLAVPAYGSSATALALCGGSLLTSGAGRIDVGARNLEPEDWAKVDFSSGEMVFSGTSTLANRGTKDLDVTFAPTAAGETMHATFRDSSVFGVKGNIFNVGSPSTTTRLAFDSSSQEHACLGVRVRVRAEGDSGEAELRVSDGKVQNDYRGLDIADDNKADVVTHGRLVQTGGWIDNRAQNDIYRTDQGKPNGFTVGYGANAPGTAGRVAFGEAFLSGGTNQNLKGVTLVGTGYGEGTVVQTGGFNWHDSETEIFGIGAAGGLGRWTVSNGTLRVKADAYIGGFSSNILTKAEAMTRWPDTRHDAEGTLTLAGGEVEFQKNLVLGADGVGTVERIGTDGTFAVGGDLVLSNTTANAQSGGTLKFVCTADGVKPLNVAGKATFCSGAKMSVDVSGWTNVTRRQWLLKTSALENPIPVEAIEIIGRTEATREVVVKRAADGYSMSIPKGTVLIVR